MKRCLLDSLFVIDLLNEVAANQRGPARAWVARNAGADLWISPITYAEVLEGADDVETVREAFRAFRWQTIGRQHGERAALRQCRADQRMGENDAWQVAVAECMDAVIVGHDRKAFNRLGVRLRGSPQGLNNARVHFFASTVTELPLRREDQAAPAPQMFCQYRP